MILVLLGTQNNSFHRLLEEIEKNIENGKIKDEVIVQSGYTKYNSDKMKIFDMIPRNELEELVKKADLVITHGGVGSMMLGIKAHKKVIAVPRLKKYEEHVNNHQIELVETFKKQGLIIGIDNVEDLGKALEKANNVTVNTNMQEGENKIIKLIEDFIDND